MNKLHKGVSLDTAARILTGGQYVAQANPNNLDTTNVSQFIARIKQDPKGAQVSQSNK
jgi:hypothetical protein